MFLLSQAYPIFPQDYSISEAPATLMMPMKNFVDFTAKSAIFQ